MFAVCAATNWVLLRTKQAMSCACSLRSCQRRTASLAQVYHCRSPGWGCCLALLQVVLSANGTAAQLVSKYRPPCPIVVVSDNEQVLRGLAGYYSIYPCKVRCCPPTSAHVMYITQLSCQPASVGVAPCSATVQVMTGAGCGVCRCLSSN